jgi:hypothetical protein
MNEKVILWGLISIIFVWLVKSLAYFIVPTDMLKNSEDYHTQSSLGRKRTLQNIKSGKLSIVLFRTFALLIFYFFGMALKVLFKFV